MSYANATALSTSVTDTPTVTTSTAVVPASKAVNHAANAVLRSKKRHAYSSLFECDVRLYWRASQAIALHRLRLSHKYRHGAAGIPIVLDGTATTQNDTCYSREYEQRQDGGRHKAPDDHSRKWFLHFGPSAGG